MCPGLRISEIRPLRWQDLDLKLRIIELSLHCPQTVYRRRVAVERVWLLDTGKHWMTSRCQGSKL
jgi:integrase